MLSTDVYTVTRIASFHRDDIRAAFPRSARPFSWREFFGGRPAAGELDPAPVAGRPVGGVTAVPSLTQRVPGPRTEPDPEHEHAA